MSQKIVGCDCMARIDKQLEEKGLRVAKNVVFHGAESYLLPEILLTRTEGQRGRSKKGDPKSVFPTYCPWCGKKYIREENE